MSLTDLDVKHLYAGNGATVDFAIPFDYQNETEVQVYIVHTTTKVETLQVVGALQDYTLIGSSPPTTPLSTTVRFNSAPSSSYQILVRRVVPLTQGNTYTDTGAWAPTTEEIAINKLTMLVQQVREIVSRSPQLRKTTTLEDISLGEPATDALLKWNTGATAIESGRTYTELMQAQDDAVNAAAVAVAAKADCDADKIATDADAVSTAADAVSTAADALAANISAGNANSSAASANNSAIDAAASRDEAVTAEHAAEAAVSGIDTSVATAAAAALAADASASAAVAAAAATAADSSAADASALAAAASAVDAAASAVAAAASASSGITKYANLAGFIAAATAGDGAFAVALDTNILYQSDGAAWTPAGGGITTYANLAAFPAPGGPTSGDGAFGVALDTNKLYQSDGAAWVEFGGGITGYADFAALPDPTVTVNGALAMTLDDRLIWVCDTATWNQIDAGNAQFASNADFANSASYLDAGDVGYVPYQDGVGHTDFVLPNVSTVKKFLRQFGNNTDPNAPTWSVLASTDIPNNSANTSGNANTATSATKSTNLVGGNNTTLLGSVPYQSAADTTTLLAPNTTTTRKFLRQTGTGTNGAAPGWDTMLSTDIAGGAKVVGLKWLQIAGNSAPLEVDEVNFIESHVFSAGLAQELYSSFKVPGSYVAGSQIKLNIAFYSPSTSGNVLFTSQSTLILENTTAVTSTANQRTSVNTAVTMATTANKYVTASLDLTDTAGLINGVAVVAGSYIKVKLYRGTDTDTADVRFIPNVVEVTLS